MASWKLFFDRRPKLMLLVIECYETRRIATFKEQNPDILVKAIRAWKRAATLVTWHGRWRATTKAAWTRKLLPHVAKREKGPQPLLSLLPPPDWYRVAHPIRVHLVEWRQVSAVRAYERTWPLFSTRGQGTAGMHNGYCSTTETRVRLNGGGNSAQDGEGRQGVGKARRRSPMGQVA